MGRSQLPSQSGRERDDDDRLTQQPAVTPDAIAFFHLVTGATRVDDPKPADALVDVPMCPNVYDPIKNTALLDPWADLADLRDHCPVSTVHTGGVEVVVVTRFEDVAAVERNHHTFGNIGHHPHPEAVAGRRPAQRNLSSTDLPRQAALRRLYLEALRPGLIDGHAPAIARIAEEITAQFVDALSTGPADLVARWAVPIPALSIATVLGLPREDAQMIHEWVESNFSDPPLNPDGSAALRRSSPIDFDTYLLAQIDRRRSAPSMSDDAISRMLRHVGPDGTTFTDDEVVFYVRDILMAGNETTTSILSNFMFRILEDRDRYERLQGEPELIDSALEESLRFDTPLMQFARLALTEASVAGFRIRAGSVLSLSMPSANRDPRRFGVDADRFVIDRYADRDVDHVAFGVGIHQCVGAYLARTTARTAVRALMGRNLPLRLVPGAVFDKLGFYEFWRSRTVPLQLDG
jgi:cytochrome P450